METTKVDNFTDHPFRPNTMNYILELIADYEDYSGSHTEAERREFVERFCRYVGPRRADNPNGWELNDDGYTELGYWAEECLRKELNYGSRLLSVLIGDIEADVDRMLEAVMKVADDIDISDEEQERMEQEAKDEGYED